jgi:hypothetical protein
MLKIYPFFFTILFSACSVSPFSLLTFKKNYLVIGKGGGISGIETNYYFPDNGWIYKQSGAEGKLSAIEKIDRPIFSQMIESCDQLNLIEYKYMEPRNTYYHLTLHINGKTNRIVWSANDKKLNPACLQIYNILNHAIDD